VHSILDSSFQNGYCFGMARPKEFDVDEALERAKELFWERGYESTSMSDLVAHLGVSRQSLYDTFGDKHAIFTAALERCRTQEGAAFARLLQGDAPIRAVLRRVFAAAIDQDLQSQCARGCMMVNATVELAGKDATVGALLCDNARFVQEAFTERLRAAQERGEIGAHHDPAALGRYFGCVLYGLRVTSKTTRDRGALEDIVRVAIGVLG